MEQFDQFKTASQKRAECLTQSHEEAVRRLEKDKATAAEQSADLAQQLRDAHDRYDDRHYCNELLKTFD
jgi:two-component sensor histidine kinase